MRTTLRWSSPRFVLVGDPGSGKSTFLRHLALCWAGETLRRRRRWCARGRWPARAGGWTGPAYTPIYVELRSLIAGDAWALERTADLPGVPELREYLRARLAREGCEAFGDELFDLLRAGRAAILLDGLDEVNQAADPRRRAQVQAFVGELAEQFRAAPIIITARPYAYGQDDWRLPGFGATDLTPLDRPRQAELAGRLFAALAELDARLTPGGAEQETAAFTNGVGRNPRRPGRQSVAADAADGDLAQARRRAIAACPTHAGSCIGAGWISCWKIGWARRSKVSHWSSNYDLIRRRSAFRAATRSVSSAETTDTASTRSRSSIRGEIFDALEFIGQRQHRAPDLLRHLRVRAGMLLEAVEQSPGTLVAVYEKQFRFLHLSFQEYLAACEFLYREGETRGLIICRCGLTGASRMD